MIQTRSYAELGNHAPKYLPSYSPTESYSLGGGDDDDDEVQEQINAEQAQQARIQRQLNIQQIQTLRRQRGFNPTPGAPPIGSLTPAKKPRPPSN